MKPTLFKNRKGFTLVELLIVISIIAVLSAVGAVAFSGVQKSARDARRKSDLNQLIKAYAQYVLANGGILPLSNECGNARAGAVHGVCVNNYDSPNDWYIGDYLYSHNYISRSPYDPKLGPNSCAYYYYTDASGQYAQFSLQLENPSVADLNTTVGGVINWSLCANGNYRQIFSL